MKRDLEAIGTLESSPRAIDELLKIAPRDMTDEQLEVAMALCKRQLALWSRTEEKRGSDIEPAEIEIEEPVSD